MPTPRPEHAPDGDPCRRCGRAAARHRKRWRHVSEGDPCARCGAPVAAHRRRPSDPPRPAPPRVVRVPATCEVIGIDGEGYTRHRPGCPARRSLKYRCTQNCPHLYTYASASTSEGLVSEISNPRGLSSQEIFDWLLSLPKRPKKVGYALGYDITKWTSDLSDHALYLLWRPDHPERAGKHGPRALQVPLGSERYSVSMVATKFSLGGSFDPASKTYKCRAIVWDVFKFFGRAFVAALKQWDVGTPEIRDEIQRMKDKRGSFDGISDEEKEYCRTETKLLAQMVEKLLAACDDAGLELSDLYGPGSLAAAMLKKGRAKAQIVALDKSPQLADAVQRAFFGGRFEINRIGPVPKMRSYDLASAYPCAETQLPCLEHGRWERVVGQDAVDRALDSREVDAGIVRWSLPRHPSIRSHLPSRKSELPDLKNLDIKSLLTLSDLTEPEICLAAWGPFPYRTSKGSILFPVVCPSGGWVYHHEYLAARSAPRIWPNVRALEAWVHLRDCDCDPPYAEEVASAYVKRLEWGKEGKGLTLKLAVNSRYGKRAQSSGSHPYRCLLAAGLITSHTRGSILGSIIAAPDPWDVSSIATDGILARVALALSDPPRTGTESAAARLGKSSLGAWEAKDPSDVFLLRPGMRFDPNLESKIDTTAARGLGVKVLHEARSKVLRAWKRAPGKGLTIQQPSQFHGGKLSISVRGRSTSEPSYFRAEKYGLWSRPDPYKVSYEPLPKRPCLAPDGRRVMSWALSEQDPPSAPYDRHVSEVLNADLQQAEDVARAQPDAEGLGPIEEDFG